MNNLWKKESCISNEHYVDIFAPLREDKWQDQFDLYINRLKTHQSAKDNQRSTEFRMQGNELFRSEKWSDAMVQYSESLRFAEVGSENIAIAYANRSGWFHQKMYDEVLIDIEHAMNSKLPDHLIPKIQIRKHMALELRQNLTIRLDDTFRTRQGRKIQLDYEPNKNFPCMADVIEIQCNEEFGQHIVAKCDIPVGKIVLDEDNLVASIIDENPVTKCYTCLRTLRNSVPCTQCSSVQFCSIDCINLNQTHKWECGTFFPKLKIVTKFLINTILLAIEIFGSVNNLMEFVEKALLEDPLNLPESLHDSRSKYHFFFKLKAAPLNSSEIKIGYIPIYKIILNLPKVRAVFNTQKKKKILMHLTVHHSYINALNPISDAEEVSLANINSIFNHSCAPNVISLIIAGKKYCVTCRPIKKDEQLFINYIGLDDTQSLDERQKDLNSNWGFICKCERCSRTHKPTNRQTFTSDPCYKFVVENHNIEEKSGMVLENCLQFLRKYGRSQWTNEIQFVIQVFQSNH